MKRDNVYGKTQLLGAVMQGQTAIVKMLFSDLPLVSFYGEVESMDNLRYYFNSFNLTFFEMVKVLNLKKAEQLYVAMTLRIDTLTRAEDVFLLWEEMIERYCVIVNEYIARAYSPTVQRVIVTVNNDISAELKLNQIAEQLNVNASYLSNLFHKETGTTITMYVNQKKLEYAAFLLSNTEWNVASIAQECGILDENYFARIFKKQYHMSPTQFRKQK